MIKSNGQPSCPNQGPFKNYSIRLVKLNWQSRITIILVGTCLLFSLFFTLDFLIYKLITVLALQQANASAPINALLSSDLPIQADSDKDTTAICLAKNPIGWLDVAKSNRNFMTKHLSDEKKAPIRTTFSVNKLGVNFEIIYENQLKLSEDQERYIVDVLGNNHNSTNVDLYPINAQLNLARILEAYQTIMPFNPDIWIFSEPQNSMHFLWGDLNRCIDDLGELIMKLEKKTESLDALSSLGIQNLKLMRFLDSFGRPEAGSLIGHPFWLGSYLECQSIGSGESKILIELENPQRKLETRYCIGKIKYNAWLPEKEEVSIKVGLCLPKNCDSLALLKQNQLLKNESLEPVERVRKRVEQLMLLNFDNRLYKIQEFSLADVYCLPIEETRQLDLTGILLILFISAWLSACIYCTWLRSLRRRQQVEVARESLVQIMAIDVNLEEFIFSKKIDKGEPIVNLNILDSVKHFGCIGVILAHVLLTYLTLGTSYNHIVEYIGKDMRTMLLLSLNNVVDTFFVISGILVAYLMFKKMESSRSVLSNRKRSDEEAKVKRRAFIVVRYFKLAASRYLRMAPLYFLVYVWTKSISAHLGSGPLWDYASNNESLRGFCKRESWFWPLTFASDFKPITEHCVPPAWSVAVDLQFFLILPIFIWLLKNSKLIGYYIIVLVIVITTASTFNQYKLLFDYISLSDFAKLRLHVFSLLIKYAANAYSHPQNRIGPILIGLIGGHMLYEYETKMRIEEEKRKQESAIENEEEEEEEKCFQLWPNWMLGRCFKTVIVLNLVFMLAPTIVQLRERTREWNESDRDSKSNLFSWIWHEMIKYLLALNTSTQFDCNLALGGFVLIKPLWSICNCILFLRLATDLNKTLVGRLMSLNIWRQISKLNYAILLIHFEFIAYEAMSRLSLGPVTWPELVGKFSFAYLCSLCAALPLHLLFEQPMHKLTRKLLV